MRWMVIAVGLALWSGAANAQRGQMTPQEYDELFEAALSYASVSVVCEDRKHIDMARNSLRRVLGFGSSKNLLNDNSRAVLADEEKYIQRGAIMYRTQHRIGRDQARQWIVKIDEISRALPY